MLTSHSILAHYPTHFAHLICSHSERKEGVRNVKAKVSTCCRAIQVFPGKVLICTRVQCRYHNHNHNIAIPDRMSALFLNVKELKRTQLQGLCQAKTVCTWLLKFKVILATDKLAEKGKLTNRKISATYLLSAQEGRKERERSVYHSTQGLTFSYIPCLNLVKKNLLLHCSGFFPPARRIKSKSSFSQ